MYQLALAIIYGIVEGVTEWLPISSTGHMLLLDKVLHPAVSPDFWHMFIMVIQLGAILAVLCRFSDKINPFDGGAGDRKNAFSLWKKIIVACIPAALIGIPLDDIIETRLGTPTVIAAMLILYGAVFILVEVAGQAKRDDDALHGAISNKTERTSDVSEITMKQALGIGAFQALSVVPGTSRSGASILGGMAFGCSRPAAAEFSFLIAIPVMLGASLIRIAKFILSGSALAAGEVVFLLVGCVSAFAVSMFAVRWLLGFVKDHTFVPFGVYRIVLGIAVLLACV